MSLINGRGFHYKNILVNGQEPVIESWSPNATVEFNVGDTFTLNDTLQPERNGKYKVIEKHGNSYKLKII